MQSIKVSSSDHKELYEGAGIGIGILSKKTTSGWALGSILSRSKLLAHQAGITPDKYTKNEITLFLRKYNGTMFWETGAYAALAKADSVGEQQYGALIASGLEIPLGSAIATQIKITYTHIFFLQDPNVSSLRNVNASAGFVVKFK